MPSRTVVLPFVVLVSVGTTVPGPRALAADATTEAAAKAKPKDVRLPRDFEDAPLRLTGARLWRLTWEQYDRTIEALLPGLFSAGEGPSRLLDEELLFDGYLNQADAGHLQGRLARQFATAAAEIAARAVNDLGRLLPCQPALALDRRCVESFVERFAGKAWRRPLVAEEQRRLLRVYDRTRAALGAVEGVRAVIETVLRSSAFLFRFETGAAPSATGEVALTDHELAAALSYTLWNRPPDGELAALATAGALHDPSVLRQQAARLVRDARAADGLHAFVSQWLGFSHVERLRNDARAFPRFTPATAAAMAEESRRFVADVLANHGGSLRVLLGASHTFLSPALGWIYGVDVDGDETAFRRIELDPRRRAGLLTQASFLAAHADHAQTSPTDRGVYLVERLLCYSPPPPPPNAPTSLPPPNAELRTTRDRLEEHRLDMGCSSCHEAFDPLGLALENYDAVGRYRSEENGRTIDASGEVRLLGAGQRGFGDAVSLVRMLAESPEVHRCVTQQLFHYVYGRTPAAGDGAVLGWALTRFRASDLDLRALLLALVTDPAFRLRRAHTTVAVTTPEEPR